MVEIGLIVCKNIDNGIGYQGDLLFRLKPDMEFFKKTTLDVENNNGMKNVVIMGYNTWKSIPNKFKPLTDRINVIITKRNYQHMMEENKIKYNNQLIISNNLIEIIDSLKLRLDVFRVFIIGGQNIYKETLDNNLIDKLYITNVLYSLSTQFIDTYLTNINYDKYQLSWKSIIYKDNATIIPLKNKQILEYYFSIFTRNNGL